MPFVPLVAMGALVFTLVNFLKSLTSRNFSAAITQLIAWVAGVAVVALVAHTDYADGVDVGGRALSTLNGSSQFFIGLMAASIFGVVTQTIKAIDNKDTAAQPTLVPSAETHPIP